MKATLTRLLAKARNASQNPGAYAFLPDIIKSLEEIQRELDRSNPDSKALVHRVGGLGRLVTESFAFSESPLGQELLGFVSDIVYTHKGRESPKG